MQIFNESSIQKLSTPKIYEDYNTLIPLIRLCLVLLMRVGSIMVQLGTFPTENIHNTIFQNLVDFSVSITAYAFLGYTLSFGKDDYCGIVSGGSWIDSISIDYRKAIFGFSAVITGSSIITMQVSGRLHLISTTLITFIYSGLVLPITMHWVWTKTSWLHKIFFLGQEINFLDYAGGFAIHTTAGIVALISSLVLGRRLLKLSEIDAMASPSSTLLGYFLFVLGLIGLSLPKDVYLNDGLNVVVVNCVVSMGVCLLGVVVFQMVFYRKRFDYWAVIRCAQGTVAGLIIVSAGVLYYSTVMCMVIGLIGAVFFSVTCRFVQISAIEDYCNVIALHVVCGFLAPIFPQIFLSKQVFTPLFFHILILLLISAIYLTIFTPLILLLHYFGVLRNETDKICNIRNRNLLLFYKKKGFFVRMFDVEGEPMVLQPGLVGIGDRFVDVLGRNENDRGKGSKEGVKEAGQDIRIANYKREYFLEENAN